MDGFEICFAAELDVGGKGNRRLKYLFSTTMWISVPFKRGDYSDRGGRKFREEMIPPTFLHMALKPLLKPCPI